MTENRPSVLYFYMIPRMSDVFFVAVLLYTAVFAGIRMLGDGDTGYHIRAGELMIKSGSVLHADPFSFIRPQLHWTTHEWLSEILMALCYHVAGLPCVVLMYALVIAVTARYLFSILVKRGQRLLASSFWVIVFLAAAKVHWLARPHIFSLLFLMFWFDVVERYQSSEGGRLWFLPVSMILWVNLHGGYIAGIFLLVIYLAGNLAYYVTDRAEWDSHGKVRAHMLAKIAGCSLIAALFNPVGYKIFLFPFQLAMDTTLTNYVSEFFSPNFHEPLMLKYLLLGLVAILGYSRRRLQPAHMFVIIFFMNMSLFSARYGPLLALVLIPILVTYMDFDLAGRFPGFERFLHNREITVSSVDQLARGIAWPVVTSLIVFFMMTDGRISYGFDPKIKPIAALEFLKKEHIAGNVFNNDEFGDLMIYALSDRYKVFIDGRLDMYHSAGILKQYFNVTSFEPGWNEILRKHGISWIFYDTKAQFTRFLLTQPEWVLIYSDKVASIFVKNIPEHRQLIANHPRVTLAKTDDKNE